MAINAIGSALGAAGINNVNNVGAGAKSASTASGDFGSKVVDALQNLDDTQKNADTLSLKAATGDLNDVHNYMIAATEASVQTEFTVAVRNKAVEAFNDIMRMQV
jgi:flagellar hook-basal body complex protein FliE